MKIAFFMDEFSVASKVLFSDNSLEAASSRRRVFEEWFAFNEKREADFLKNKIFSKIVGTSFKKATLFHVTLIEKHNFQPTSKKYKSCLTQENPE
ncbi:MAG: hypothetical protein AAF960_10765 [Bacteroidota bacterium]